MYWGHQSFRIVIKGNSFSLQELHIYLVFYCREFFYTWSSLLASVNIRSRECVNPYSGFIHETVTGFVLEYSAPTIKVVLLHAFSLFEICIYFFFTIEMLTTRNKWYQILMLCLTSKEFVTLKSCFLQQHFSAMKLLLLSECSQPPVVCKEYVEDTPWVSEIMDSTK